MKAEIATFAAGCFWGVEHIFLKHFPPSQDKGILSTQVGYTGGNPIVTNPTYKLVCDGATDHAEAVRIEFDPSKVTYAQLVGAYMSIELHIITHSIFLAEFFFRTHDPTTLNRQGNDTGSRKYDPPRVIHRPYPYFQPSPCLIRPHTHLSSRLIEYRSAIFTHSDEQETIAKRVTEEVQAQHFKG